MRGLGVQTTLFLLVMLCGCGGRGGPSGGSASSEAVSGIPVTRPAYSDKEGNRLAPPPLTLLDKEVAKQAIDRWKPTELGGSYYLCVIDSFQDCPIKGRTVIELRQPSIEVHPEAVDEADKLNGIAWKGSVRLMANAIRLYCPEKLPHEKFGGGYHPADSPDEKWGQWKRITNNAPNDCLTVVDLVKTNGKWAAADRGWAYEICFRGTRSPTSTPLPMLAGKATSYKRHDIACKEVTQSDLPK